MKASFRNRYGRLREVVLCYPVHYRVMKDEIDKGLVYKQYNGLVNTLAENGVKTYFLNTSHGISQVYTRDIAFVIDDILFFSRMKASKRRQEHKALEELIKGSGIRTIYMKEFIEGGDVIVHNDVVFVGLSKATSIYGINELQKVLDREGKEIEVIPIRFDKEKMLHLDCGFNIFSKDACVYTDFIFGEDIEVIKRHFSRCYFIEREEGRALATNFVCIDDGVVISSSRVLCERLNVDGFRGIFLEYSEIVKGGGAFTCTTLPLFSEG